MRKSTFEAQKNYERCYREQLRFLYRLWAVGGEYLYVPDGEHDLGRAGLDVLVARDTHPRWVTYEQKVVHPLFSCPTHKRGELSSHKDKAIPCGICSTMMEFDPYDAMCLEIVQTTEDGQRKLGWMFTGRFDYLIYGFHQPDWSIKAYRMRFDALVSWFTAPMANEKPRWKQFRTTTTKESYKATVSIVPIDDLRQIQGIEWLEVFVPPPTKREDGTWNYLPMG